MVVNHYDKLFFIDDGWVITRLQSGGWDQEVTDEDTEEIGNENIIENIIDPIVPNTITLNTNDWGATDFLAQLLGSEADADGAGNEYGGLTADRNQWDFGNPEMKGQVCDLICRVRNPSSGNLDRTVWLPNAYITNINWNYSVDGNATENVTLRSDTDRLFIGEFKDAQTTVGTYASATTFNTTTDEGTGTYTELYMSINGTIYDAATYITSWAGTLVTVSGSAPALVATDRLRLLYYASPFSNTFTTLDTDTLGAVKAPYVKIGLGDTVEVSSGDKTLKLQSVDVNVNITREDIKEIGTAQIIQSTMTKQDVTVDATVLEDDLENYAYMLGVTAAEWTARDTAGIDIKIQDSIGNAQGLYVLVYDDSAQTNLLKTLTVSNLRLVSSPLSQDVGGRGQLSLSLKGSIWGWVGEDPTGSNLADAYPNLWPTT